MNQTMMIGQFSRKAGVSPDTVRFYEREGLLRPARGENNYRVYGTEDLTRMDIINRARTSGFTLADIRGLLALISSGHDQCADYEQTARAKLAALDEQIKALQETRDRLQQAVDACTADSAREHCNFIPALPSGPRPSGNT